MTERRQAIAAYEAFHGEPYNGIAESRLPDDDVEGYRLGTVEAIAYRAKRYGKLEHYIHEFDKTAGPHLDVSHDGTQLFLTDGDYCVTDHGIEDHKMPLLLAVNPSKPGSKPKYKVLSNMSKPKRNRKGQFVKGSRAAAKPRRRKSNPSPPPKAKARRRSYAGGANSPAIVYMQPEHRKSNPAKRRSRNPIGSHRGGMLGLNLTDLAVSGFSQATGAVVTSAVFKFVPIPPQYKTGPTGAAVKIGLGIAMAAMLAKAGRKSAKMRQFAQNFAEGTITLAMVDWLSQVLPKNISSMGLVQDSMGLVQDAMGNIVYEGEDAQFIVQEPDGTMQFITPGTIVQDANLSGVQGAYEYQNY